MLSGTQSKDKKNWKEIVFVTLLSRSVLGRHRCSSSKTICVYFRIKQMSKYFEAVGHQGSQHRRELQVQNKRIQILQC